MTDASKPEWVKSKIYCDTCKKNSADINGYCRECCACCTEDEVEQALKAQREKIKSMVSDIQKEHKRWQEDPENKEYSTGGFETCGDILEFLNKI